jgi:hypothetical protein
MSLLEEELHPPRHDLDEGPTVQILLETLTSLSPYFLNGSASLLQSCSLVCFEVRREVSIYRGGNLEKWRTSPSF